MSRLRHATYSYPRTPMLRLAPLVYKQMVGHCYDGLPDEACGLLGGDPATGKAVVCYPATNVDASARTYTVDPKDILRADRDADARGITLMGVFHSHTHTEAYPSPTDVAQAPDPEWRYVIVSLKDEAPVVRSYRIVDGNIGEEPVVLEGK
jgi:[CysO sulfur-carrier protein]-S-L-cysteine hydrolase